MTESLLTLPMEERIRLVEDLWDSIEAEQGGLPLSEAQKRHLDQRLDAYERDGNKGRDAHAAIADMKRKL